MAPFTRAHRIQVSTPELDATELRWWNANSGLIEQIWGLPDEICRLTREHYLLDVRNLLLKHCKQTPARVLELACGTGWAGRLLSDERLHVVGLDFSEEQVRTAEEKAKASGKKFCSYIQRDVNELSSLLKNMPFDALFIHCGIHHLSVKELRDLTRSLAQIERGTPVVLVEPMYHDKFNPLGRLLQCGLEVVYRTFSHFVMRPQPSDPAIEGPTNAMFAEADANGWFLSPKEMPFSRDEITGLFEEEFEILDMAPVTLYGLRLGQQLAMLKDQEVAHQIGRAWLPSFGALDEFLIAKRLMPMLSRDYLFTSIVLKRR